MNDTVTLDRKDAQALLNMALIGNAVQAFVANCAMFGHASPAGTLDYWHAEPWTADAFVKDFVAWTSGRRHMAEGCEDRLREWGLEEARIRMNRVGELIQPDSLKQAS
jgi:hypothetical protein